MARVRQILLPVVILLAFSLFMPGIDFSVTISGRPHVLHILLPAVVIISWCNHVTSGRDRAGVYGLRLRVAAWLRPRRSLRVNAGGRRPLFALELDPTRPDPTQYGPTQPIAMSDGRRPLSGLAGDLHGRQQLPRRL